MFALNLPLRFMSLSSSCLDKIVNTYSDIFGLYGGGAVDLIVRRGGISGALSCPWGWVNLMEELRWSLIPPRSKMSLLGAGWPSSMLHGDSWRSVGSQRLCPPSSDDEVEQPTLHDPLPHKHKTHHTGFLAGGKTIYRRGEQTMICSEFLEIIGVDFDGRNFSGFYKCSWAMNLEENRLRMECGTY